MKIRLLLAFFLVSTLGHSRDIPQFKEIEERGGWDFETTRLKHGVRLNRRTWRSDRAMVAYDLFIDGKHLWSIEFKNGSIFFAPMTINADKHILSHVVSDAQNQHVLDLVTFDRSGYIASITFHRQTSSVSVASDVELKERLSSMEWTDDTKLYVGPDFADPEWVFTGSLPKMKPPAEQGGAGQPATRPELKSEGSDKPQPESEGRSR